MKLETLSNEKIDAVMSLVPEMVLGKIAVGTPCLDQLTNKTLTVIGNYKDSSLKDVLHLSAFKTDHKMLKGVVNNSEGEFTNSSLIHLKALIDSEQESVETLARESLVYHDVDFLNKLLSVELQDYDMQLLVKNSFLRGICNMIDILKTEYITFLKRNGLLERLIGKLMAKADQSNQRIESVEHLEQFADILQDQVAFTDNHLLNCSNLKLLMVSQVFAIKETKVTKFLTWDHLNREIIFEFSEDFGSKKGLPFHGKLTENSIHVAVNEKMQDDQILLIDSDILLKLSQETQEMLMNARIVITNSSAGLSELINRLADEV